MRNDKGQFVKGHVGYKSWKGKKLSDETKVKISKKLKGQVLSEVTKQRMSKARKGIPHPWSKGKKHTAEHRLKRSVLMKGSNHWNWQGGKSKESMRNRRTIEYKMWREEVLKRDNYKCRMCACENIPLQVDHRRPLKLFPEMRLNLNNGRTLCKDCHIQKTRMDMKFINKKLDLNIMLMVTNDLD